MSGGGALAARPAEEGGEKGRVGTTTVSRYRAGKRPEWIREEEGEGLIPRVARQPAPDLATPAAKPEAEIAAPVVVRRVEDPRLRRLAAAQGARRTGDSEGRARRRAAAGGVAAPGVSPARAEPGERDGVAAPQVVRRHGRGRGAGAGEPSGDRANLAEGSDAEGGGEARRAYRREGRTGEAEADGGAGGGAGPRGASRLADPEPSPAPGASPEPSPAPGASPARSASASSSSSYESESESEPEPEGGQRTLLRPVFVPKSQRRSAAEREAKEAEVARRAEEEEAQAEARREESRAMARRAAEAEEAARLAAEQGDGPAGLGDVDTDDERADPGSELEAWRRREFARIERDRLLDASAGMAARLGALRLQRAAHGGGSVRGAAGLLAGPEGWTPRDERDRWGGGGEAAAVDRGEPGSPRVRGRGRRPLDTGDRVPGASDRVPGREPTKGSRAFLQKYHHRGAFFQDEEDDESGVGAGARVREATAMRDAQAPTGADKGHDRSALPAVMQVRNFGRRGQTKWTHLASEDTTRQAGHDYREAGYGGRAPWGTPAVRGGFPADRPGEGGRRDAVDGPPGSGANAFSIGSREGRDRRDDARGDRDRHDWDRSHARR